MSVEVAADVILIQMFVSSQHTVVTVAGDHHVHLNNPEAVAPLLSDFLQTAAVPQQHHKL